MPLGRLAKRVLNSSGLSLLELIVTVVIVAIISSLAIPSFAGLRNEYKVRKASRQLMTDLQYAKMKAIAEVVQYKVSFNSGTAAYSIYKGNSASGSTTWTQDGVSRQLSVASNPYYTPGVALSANVDVIFAPIGTASPATGTTTPSITLTTTSGGTKTKQVTVLLTGRVRIS